MILARFLTVASLVAVIAVPATAQESGNFVIRLGSDTTAVEHFTISPTQVEIDQVGRVPRVLTRHSTFDFGPGGDMTRAAITVTRPGAPASEAPVQVVNATFTGDSALLQIHGAMGNRDIHAAVPRGTVVIVGSPWAMYERLTRRLAGTKADSLGAPLYLAGVEALGWISVQRRGAGLMDIATQYDRYHAQVDAQGRLQHVDPVTGTQQFTVDRVKSLDVAATTARFQAGEQQGGAAGPLSTRDTVRSTSTGATLWIDYGQPAKRGRTIFGAVVPYGEVWRTGANAATQFRTDKDLVFGGTVVPAGFYSLWTVPSATGWKLIFNSETGQWGTEHKAAKDLYTVDMQVTPLADPVERFTMLVAPGSDGGGELRMEWDTTRASVTFKVKS